MSVFLASVLAAIAMAWSHVQSVALGLFESVREVAAMEASADRAFVIFGGDLMFDRSIRGAMARRGEDHVLGCVSPILAWRDLTVANLEGPITAEPSVSVGSVPGDADNMTFTFAPFVAQVLARHHIGAVSLANNHIMNFGQDGVRSTMSLLDTAGVVHFGDPLTYGVAEADVRDVPLSLIGYNEFVGSPDANAETAILQIRAAREKGRLPVVMAHWGQEYEPIAPEYVRARAHKFVDAGAELVVGAHPHVVQNSEVYAGKHIYYSLGNFVFDQYWEYAVSHGLLLQVVFTPDGVENVSQIPIELGRDGATCPASA